MATIPWPLMPPPTPETYILALWIFQYFPIFSIIQWLTSFHPAGKTSLSRSFLNLPGKLGWFIMEIVGPANLLYALGSHRRALLSLPWPNLLVVALYLIHYANRAVLTPFFVAPSMSPIHLLVVAMAVAFNWLNSTCIAAWVLGYPVPVRGHTTDGLGSSPSRMTAALPYVGVALFALGMLGNIRAERTLFRLRREEADKRVAKKADDAASNSTGKYSKVYVIPPATGLFRFILYPHYVCEWLEWLGFALVGTAVYPSATLVAASSSSSAVFGSAASLLPLRLVPWLTPAAALAERLGVPLPLPAVVFVINAVTNMLPHARWGRKWYVQKFGDEAVAGRGAVVPYCSWM